MELAPFFLSSIKYYIKMQLVLQQAAMLILTTSDKVFSR